MKRAIAILILWSATLAAAAQPPPAGAPPHPPGPSSPEALATIPDLTAMQQTELRKILLDRRDAHEAVESKSRAEHDALAKKDRSEHERIDEAGAERLRKLLGDDGFRQFAQWQFAHHPGGGEPGAGPQGPHGAPRHGPHPASGKVALGPDTDIDQDDD
jgi:hypothetical protein